MRPKSVPQPRSKPSAPSRSVTSPAYCAASNSASFSPIAGPSRPSSAAISSPRRSGCRRAFAVPVEPRRDHLASQIEVRLDHLGAGDRARPAGRQAVGDGQERDVDRDRFGGAQVFVDAARRQRRVFDHEAEPQVLERQRLQVAGQLPRGAQPPHDLADRLRPDHVVAAEADEAVDFPPRRRLGDVVEEGAEAERGGAVHLVGERLGEEGGGFVGPVLADEPGQVRPRSRACARAPRACARGRRGDGWGPGRRPWSASSSGRTTAVIRSSSRSARPPSGSGPPSSWRSSASWRSPAGSAARAALCVGERDGLGVDLQVRAGRRGGRRAAAAAGPPRSCAGRPRGARRVRGRRARRMDRSPPPPRAARRRRRR